MNDKKRNDKKRNVMLFVLLFTLLLGVIVPVQAQSDGGTKTIRVAYREDADFINKSSSGVYKGYGVEYLNKISQYTGWKYEYINEPWEDQLADLKSGKVDLICNAQKTEAREKDYDFSCMPVGTEQAVLYTSEDNEDIYFLYIYLNIFSNNEKELEYLLNKIYEVGYLYWNLQL